MQTVPSGGQVFSVTPENGAGGEPGGPRLVPTYPDCLALVLSWPISSPLLQQMDWERPDLAEAD